MGRGKGGGEGGVMHVCMYVCIYVCMYIHANRRESENARPENNFFKNRERKIICTEIKEREIRKQITKQKRKQYFMI